MADNDEEYVWQPPTPAEMKVLQARRERDNTISQRMGDYLLKGYKMLGIVCQCGTILLQDKRGTNYCIACEELDSDVDKDNPVMSSTAAQSQVREQELSSDIPTESNAPKRVEAPIETHQDTAARACAQAPPCEPSLQTVNVSRISIDAPVSRPCQNLIPPHLLADASEALTEKLAWATDELKRTSRVEYNIQLCQLIKHCIEALQATK